MGLGTCLRNSIFRGLFVVIATLATATLHAAEVRLFTEPRVPVSDYDSRVNALGIDDWLVFGDGRRIRVGAKLGSGGFTSIYEVLEMEPADTSPEIPKAIRLSQSVKYHPIARKNFLDVLDEFLPAQTLLEHGGMPVVRAFREQSAEHEFVIVEKLEIEFTYLDFLNGTRRAKALSPEERHRVTDDFLIFAEQGFRFRSVGDQLPEQIGYVKGRGWLFFDFNQNTSRAEYITDATLFTSDAAMIFAGMHAVQDGRMLGGGDERLPLPSNIHRRVHKAIHDRRLREGFAYSACWQMLESAVRRLKARF